MFSIKVFTTGVLISGICMMGFPQEEGPAARMVQGTIEDAATRTPVEGISISVPGFSSVFTDSTGNFSISVPDGQSVLRVSGMGYQSKEIPLKGAGQVTISLYEKGYQSLNEMAYLYYTEKPLAYTTQSVVSLNTAQTAWRHPGCSSEKVFDDQVPGLRILSRSGVPGMGSNLFLRGFASLYSTNQPLIIVDGLIYETQQYGTPIIGGFISNPLSSININDIENITVIRDAASIYGSRASGGVIMIRTNHPHDMATRIDFSMYGGINFEPRQISLLKSEDYRTYLTEILQTSSLSIDSIASLPFLIDNPQYPEYYRYHNEINWQDEVFTNSINQNVNLKITGGDDIALYALSVGYQKHEGIVQNTDFSRYSFRFNSNINISTKLTLVTNLGFTFNQHHLKDDGDSPHTNPFHLSLIKSPFLYPYVRSSTGAISPNLEDADFFGVGNPTAVIKSLSATSNNYKILGSVDVGYRAGDHLSVHNFLGINFDKLRDNLFSPYLGIAGDTLDLGIAGNKVAHKVERYFNVYDDLRLTYLRTFNWKHDMAIVAGMRLGINSTQGDWGMDYNTPNDQMRSLGSGVSTLRDVDGYLGDWNWITFYARADYNYNHKYFATLNLALDGSSRFGKEAEGISMFSGTFGVFPSVAAAWLISSEPFLASAGMIDLLKLRVSYGITGNDAIGNYTASKYYVSQNFLGSEGLVMGNLWNPALQWETNKKLNGGLDATLLNERLVLRLDLYQNRTEDLLNIMEAPPLSGFSYYLDNNGAFISRGFDLALNGRILNGQLRWDAGLILSRYRTEVTEFPVDQRITSFSGASIITRMGEPINQFYGYRTLGVFASQAEADASGLRALMPNTDLVPFSAGDVHFEDIDNNGVIDENDMQVIGDPNPDFTGMASSRLEWKGIALDLGLSFTYGNDIYNHLRYRLESMQNADNQTPVVLNRWREEGQVTDLPAARWGDPIGNARFSDRWIEDGSYIRLSYVTLSYNIPLKPRFVNSIEVFISGQNLVTLSSYLGMDPEFSLSELSLYQGIDIGLTPQPKSVFMGIKIGL